MSLRLGKLCFCSFSDGRFFPGFLQKLLVLRMDPTVSTARLGFANAVAGLLVAILSPFLVRRRCRRAKKRFLGTFVVLGVSATGALFMIDRQLGTGSCSFVIASVGFNCANLFYDSLLIDVTEREQMDMVSSMGYSFGYLGCGPFPSKCIYGAETAFSACRDGGGCKGIFPDGIGVVDALFGTHVYVCKEPMFAECGNLRNYPGEFKETPCYICKDREKQTSASVSGGILDVH